MITPAQADEAARTLDEGGVILFGADTVYGLACSAEHPAAVARMLRIKGRTADKPSAILAFTREAAEPLLMPLGPRTRRAAEELLPGPVTLVLPSGAGLRVPRLAAAAAALARITTLVVQSSANPAGGRAPASLDDVEPGLRAAVDAELDAGVLPGAASSVIDLARYEDYGEWALLREGAVDRATLVATLGPPSV